MAALILPKEMRLTSQDNETLRENERGELREGHMPQTASVMEAQRWRG